MLQQSRELLHVPIVGAAGVTADVLRVSLDNGVTWLPFDTWDGQTAALLVGPGAPAGPLTAGSHRVLVQITSPPEVIVLAGTVAVQP